MAESRPVSETGNPRQNEAITHRRGPCLVLAGPGSGKTYVIVQHIRFLLEEMHAEPSSILVLTFSRAAAGEMRTRFQKGGPAPVVFGTFHSVFYHILSQIRGKPPKIIPAKTKRDLLEALIRQYLGKKPEETDLEEAERIITAEKAGKDIPRSQTSAPGMDRICEEYQRFLKENGMIDFDDMITGCRRALLETPEALSFWQRKFRYILCDEFQDISPSQYEVLRLLAGGRQDPELFCVGDDDQTIYSFRGADPDIVNTFLADFPDTHLVQLQVNYRSSGKIIEASQKVIEKNTCRIAKQIVPAGGRGEPVILLPFSDRDREYASIASSLNKMCCGRWGQAAVIVRTNRQAAGAAAMLEKAGIPAAFKAPEKRNRKLSFIQRDLEGYQRLAGEVREGRIEDTALFAVMNRPLRYLTSSCMPARSASPARILGNLPYPSPAYQSLYQLFSDCLHLAQGSVSFFVQYLFYAMGYRDFAVLEAGEEGRAEAERTLSWIEEKAEGCRSFSQLWQILREESPPPPKEKKDGVRVITMHASKGLEYDTVVLPDLTDHIFPPARCREQKELEEERRLLYVAMTRARKHLVLCYQEGSPSEFLLPLTVKKGVLIARN